VQRCLRSSVLESSRGFLQALLLAGVYVCVRVHVCWRAAELACLRGGVLA
jgi:hypothetical protein